MLLPQHKNDRENSNRHSEQRKHRPQFIHHQRLCGEGERFFELKEEEFHNVKVVREKMNHLNLLKFKMKMVHLKRKMLNLDYLMVSTLKSLRVLKKVTK